MSPLLPAVPPCIHSKNADSRLRSRRIMLPVMVAVVGVAMVIWSNSRTTRQIEEVEQFVTALCRSVAEGQDIAGVAGSSSPIVVDQVRRSLDGMFGQHSELLADVSVEIAPGDTGPVGAGTQALPHEAATHTATIRLGDQPRLGLRLQYVDQSNIRILGCFEPQ